MLPPVLVVPGMGEYADEYDWLLDALGDRRVVIVDVRGRGRSDVPDTGYRWEDHIGDLRAAVEQLVHRPTDRGGVLARLRRTRSGTRCTTRPSCAAS